MSNFIMPKFKVNLDKQLNKYFSCDLDVFFQLKICYLRIPKILIQQNSSSSWFYIISVIRNGEIELCSPISTRHQPKINQICFFNEPIKYPVKIKDLNIDSNILFKIIHIFSSLQVKEIYNCSYPIFNPDGQLCFHQHEVIFNDNTFENLENFDKIKQKFSQLQNYMNDTFEPLPYYPWVEKMTYNYISSVSKTNDADPSCMTLIIEFKELSISHPYMVLYQSSDVNKDISTQVNYPFKTPFDSGFEEINLVEEKQHFQLKNSSNSRQSPRIKPTSIIREKLNKIVKAPSVKPLSQDDKDNILAYSHFLAENPEALSKFLLCIDLSHLNEKEEIRELVYKWKKLSPSLALELLTPKYENLFIRSYALSCLSSASEEELNLYLLNLVFALDSDINYLQAIQEKSPDQDIYQDVKGNIFINHERFKKFIFKQNNSCLLQFLFKRCSSSDILANSFYWYMNIASMNDGKTDKKPLFYNLMIQIFLDVLSDKAFLTRKIQIEKQKELFNKILKITEKLKLVNASRKLKISTFQNFLASDDDFTYIDVACPLSPEIKLTNVIPEKCFIFNSVQMPLKFCFQTHDQTEYNFIYKDGDDLRQDQIILTMFSIINKILLNENIDLKLTPYRVISISPTCGLIEYIPSISVAEILSTYGSIQAYFESLSTNQGFINPSILENYVKSCAGYSVLTYLFGVGDRHLDNILITSEGKLFHIDFAYILGNDPKPYPPQIKLTSDMVDGMGGQNSQEYEYFLRLCSLAFIHLRLNANTIVNIFSMIVNSNFVEINIGPEKAVLKLYEKFHLDLNDEEAQNQLLNVIFDSYKAVIAPIVEKIHQLAQKMRQ